MSDNPVSDVLQQVVSQNQQPDPGQPTEIEQKSADLEQEKAIQEQSRLVNWALVGTLPLAIVSYYVFLVPLATGLILYPITTAIITGLVVAAISGVIIYQFRKHTASYLEVWAKRKTAESAQ